MADYQSKYTGNQVEALLDIVSQGGGGGGEGGEVQKTTEAEIAAMGFTKNLGTITEVKMNGASKGTEGVVDLGTVITSHQDISGKQDKLVSGTNIKTINGQSILGSGNIAIEGGGGGSSSGKKEVVVWDFFNGESVTNMRYDVVYWFVGIDNVIIDSFEEPIAEGYSYDEFTAVVELGVGGASSISLTLPDYVIWANGTIPEVVYGVNQYELSITRISDGYDSIYRAVLTPFKSV